MMNTVRPLTETMRGMFLEWNEEPESTRYTLAVVNRFPKTVDAERLARAVEDAVAADPLFRTRIVENEDGVGWTMDDGIVIRVERIAMQEAEAAAYVRNFARGFDAFTGPFARFRLIETPESVCLATEIFHLISDGTSFRSLLDEIEARYRGVEAGAGHSAEPFFCRYAETEADRFSGEEYAAAKADAARRFAGRAMTGVEGGRTGSVADGGETFLFEQAEVERKDVDVFCGRLGINANLFFMGVFARTLSLYSREKDVVFTTVNHGRGRGAVPAGARGCFVKLVPVLGEMKGGATLPEYFGGFRLHRAGVYPFSHFCRDLGMKGGWTFVYQEGTVDCVLDLDGARSEFLMPMSGGAGTVPGVEVYGGGERFVIKISCTPGAYDRGFLRGFAERMKTVAANFLATGAEDLLKDVPVLSQAEMTDVLAVSRGEILEYDRSRTFIDVFREQAGRRPEATAVVDAKTRLTYRELDERSDALAGKLLSAGVEPGGFVVVKLPRTVDFVVAAIAVQKCGCGYVPVDPEYPQDRIDYMVADCGARVVVDEEAVAGGRSGSERNSVLGLGPRPSSPAYMIYTSGSTGRPKGVVVPHRALANLIAWVPHDFGVTERSRVASHPSFSFDASVIDIFPTLAAGAELHILDENIRRDVPGMVEYVKRNGITGLTMSMQIGMAVINAYPDIPLEYIELGGEKLLPMTKTKVRIVNEYGPTEFGVCSSYHVVDQTKDADIPIGRAVPNTWSLVVDALGQPVPAGMAGEIALVGPQLSDGYWHQPEKTAGAFVGSSIRRFADYERMYRTGDLARYNEEGNLEYLGRIDTQVKLRGFRIEIGEIESVAKQFPGVGAVAAEVRKVGGAEHLVLYFEESRPDGAAVPTSEFKAFLASKLTGYMVPDYFVAQEKLPMTPNGKIDRRKLPDPRAERVEAVRPDGEMEERVFAAVVAVLRRDDFGVTHDFNELGMTSLTAMELAIKLYRTTGTKVSMRELAASPTVRKLAARLQTSRISPTSQTPWASASVTTAPLAENQRSVYVDWLRNPGTTQYNIPVAIRFVGIDAKKLAGAVAAVLDAHASFAIRLSEKDGEIVQTIGERCPVETVELTAEPDAAFFSAQVRPFTPLGESLARVKVFSVAGASSPEIERSSASYLFLDVHHIVFDGCSMGIVFEDLRRALAGETPVKEARTALDAVTAERRYAESEQREKDERWFELYLGGAESTAIEESESGADGAPGEAGRVSRLVPAAALEARAKALGVTASDCFLALFTELLRRNAANDEVLVNFVTAGRTDPDSAGATGMFVKTLPVRGIRGAKSLDAAVRRMHEDVLDLIDRERVSYRRLVERCGIRPEVMFAYEGGIFEPPEGVELIALGTDVVKTPFAVTVTPGPGGFRIDFEYDRSRYSETDMQGLADRFAELAASFANPESAAAVPEGAEPANETERTIAEIYRGLLNLERFGATDDFFGLGGTSIVAINAVIALQKAGFPVQYGDVFAHKTPRALADWMAGKGKDEEARGAEERNLSDYDYVPIDRMLRRTRRELYEGFELHPLGTVLLAGATGYLGMHVLRYLLERTDSPLVLLVRSKRGVGPERRVDSQYVYYFGERLPERFRARISFVEGDITAEIEAGGGTGRIDTVINCAALVKHYVADDRMAKINVRGVENLIAFCAKNGARLVQTSTCSIGGAVRAVSGKKLDERRLYIGQETDNEYIRTKFLAERAVLEATAAGRIRGKIMRLGNLMGRESDGEFQMNVHENAFVNSLRTYRALGAYPLEELTRPLEMSPIDRVAEAVCLLATTPDDMYVFHPYNRYALDMGAVVAAMNDRGLAVEPVSRAEFAARVEALKADPARAAELQGILHYAARLAEGLKITEPENGWTSTVLYRLGFRWRPAEDGYLGSFLAKLGELAVFD